MHCIVLYCIVLYCVVLYCIALHCIALHCIVLYCIALYCIVCMYIYIYTCINIYIYAYVLILYDNSRESTNSDAIAVDTQVNQEGDEITMIIVIQKNTPKQIRHSGTDSNLDTLRNGGS